MSVTAEGSEDRKNQILDAAVKVFTRLGFFKARMDDIVKESNLSKGTLYWYFKSKDDLILAIMERIFNPEFKQLEEIAELNESPRALLGKFTDYIIEDLDRMMPLMPLFYDFFAMGLRNKSIRRLMGGFLHQFIDSLEPIILRGVEMGEFRQVDPRETALTMGAIMEGTILLWTYDPDSVIIVNNIRSGMTILMNGLLAEPEEFGLPLDDNKTAKNNKGV
ncbi:MAG: TetR/AcrR family transcriptional regulator [Anaerolineaceae bacterium]|nr:TetR/AcrR family transcriptional regulator [Anaerolineaceae bacterium]